MCCSICIITFSQTSLLIHKCTLTARAALQVTYNSSLVYTVGKGGWASVLPASGTLTLNQPASFNIQVNPSAAATGYSTVYLALMQTYPASANTQTLMGTVEISYFNFGATSVNFTSIAPNGDGTANVSTTVAVDFTAPAGSSVPMAGAISTDASNSSAACLASGASSVVGSTSYYTCDASVPIKVRIHQNALQSLALPVLCAQGPLPLSL